MSNERIGQNDINRIADLTADLHAVVEHHASAMLNADLIKAIDVNNDIATVGLMVESACRAVIRNWIESRSIIITTNDDHEPTSPAPQSPGEMYKIAQAVNAGLDGTTSTAPTADEADRIKPTIVSPPKLNLVGDSSCAETGQCQREAERMTLAANNIDGIQHTRDAVMREVERYAA